MVRRRAFIREMLADLFVFTILFCFLAPLLYVLYGSMKPVLSAFGLLIPFFALSASRHIQRLPLFLAVHILIAVWPLFIADGFLRLLLFPFMLISAVYSLSARLRGSQGNRLPAIVPGIVTAVIIALILEYHGLENVAALIHFCTFIMLACYIVYAQTLRVDDSLDLLQDAARQPVKTTLRFHNAALVPFLMLSALAAFASAIIRPGAMITGLSAAFQAVMRFIAAFVWWLIELLQRFSFLKPVEMGVEQQPFSYENFLQEAQPTPRWLVILDILLRYLVSAALIALLVFALIKAIRLLLKRFYSRLPDDGYEREYIGSGLNTEALRKRLRSLRGRFGNTQTEKIRRAYFKKVSRHIRRGADVVMSDTADEIEHKLLGREDLSEITGAYNRARYGDNR